MTAPRCSIGGSQLAAGDAVDCCTGPAACGWGDAIAWDGLGALTALQALLLPQVAATFVGS
jgi:hypothetical protein